MNLDERESPRMDVTTNDGIDQREVVRCLVSIAEDWLKPMPAGCERMNPLPERLDGFVFSLFVQLEGAGAMEQMRLSPKGRPEVDLVEHHMHGQWPNTDADDQHVRTFLGGVAAILRHAQAVNAEPREVMFWLAHRICLLIEDGYELRPQLFDENEHIGEGDDVAPGLPEAFALAWATAA
jgi:hypothetical protein